jgi:hypothetical protein
VIEVLDNVSIALGVISFAFMTYAFRLIAIQVATESERFPDLAWVFNALALMCAVFFVTVLLSPSLPEYGWLWRLVNRVPLFGIVFELCRFLWWRRKQGNGKH